MERPGWPEPDEVPVRVGDVVDVIAEARAHLATFDPARAQDPDLSVELGGGKLETGAPTGLATAIRVPGEDEVRALLEDEEGTVRVLALVVGSLRPVAEQPRVEIDGAVEIGDVEVNRRDETHGAYRRLPAAGAFRFSRAFFLRWRSFFQRTVALAPRPIGRALYRGQTDRGRATNCCTEGRAISRILAGRSSPLPPCRG